MWSTIIRGLYVKKRALFNADLACSSAAEEHFSKAQCRRFQNNTVFLVGFEELFDLAFFYH